MSEYVVAQAAVLIVPSLGKGTDSFHKKLEAELKRQKHEIEVQVKASQASIAKTLAEINMAKDAAEKDPIKIRVDTVDVTKKLTEIRHKYEDLSRELKKDLVLNLKVAGMSLLPQLASGLAAANASMVQLAQSALLLPGVLSGVASSVATLLTGVSGLKAAFKEYTDAQKNAAQTGLQARNAALNVNNAYRDLNRTVKDAKRNLEDLNAQLRDAPLDEADAIIRVAEARAEAADKAKKSGLDQQKDTLNVLKAENELADVRLRNSRLVQDVAEANAKGVAGNNDVADAADRLSKALDDAATKQTKLSDSFAQLSPNAKNFVESVKGMAGQWQAFKAATQDRLFDGLGAEVQRLANNDLPLLQKGFSNIASELNGNVKTAMGVLQSDTNKGFLDRIFGNTAQAQGKFDQVFAPLTDGLLRLSAVGSDFLPRLADGLADLLTRFDNFVVRAEGDGSLDKWMNNGIDALKELGNSMLNVASIMNSISDAFTGSGGRGMLGSLEDGTKKLADFLKSAEGQEKLSKFFSEARAELAQWKPVLEKLPDLFSNVAAAGKNWADLIMPFLRTASGLLASHPGLVNAVFTAYMGWKTLSPIIGGVSKAIGAVNDGISLFKTRTDQAGNTIDGTSGLKSKFRGFASSMLSGGGIITVLGTLTAVLGTNLVAAHDAAKDAADRQKASLDQLKGSLNDVSGAATGATLEMLGKNLTTATNEATGVQTQDLRSVFQGDANKESDYNKRVAAGDLSGALALIPGGMTPQDVEKSPEWQQWGQQMRDAGLDSRTVADAVNGNPEARKKFDDWRMSKMRVLPFMSDEWNKAVYDATPHVGASKLPDLKALQDRLPAGARQQSILQGETYTNAAGVASQGAAIRAENQGTQGRYRLPQGSPFSGLGVVDNSVGVAADGSHGSVTVTSKPSGAALDALHNDGVTFTSDGNGRWVASIPPDKFPKYLQKYASGGQVSGPGSGTSDSILARLSHGEYVVNAKSTAQHKPLLDRINSGAPGFAGGGLVLPRFDGGGFIGGAGSGGGTAGFYKTPGPVASSVTVGGAPKMETSGISGPKYWIDNNQQRLSSLFSQDNAAAVYNGLAWTGNQILGGLGVKQVDGYSQTNTATVSTANSAWNALTTSSVDVSHPGNLIGSGFGYTGPVPTANPYTSPAPASVPGLATPAAVAPKPYNAGIHVGRGGQPGPDGQRSTAGYAPGIPASPSPKLGQNSPFDLTMPGLYDPATGKYSEYDRATGKYADKPLIGTGSPTLVPGLAPPLLGAERLPTVQTPVSATGSGKTPIYVPGSSPAGSYVAPSATVLQRINDFVGFADSVPYVWGGFSPEGMDCTGLVLAVANIAAGRDPFEGGRVASAIGEGMFFTGNEGRELAARGFIPGSGGPGTLTVGWDANHSGVTLPDGRNIDAQNQTNGIVLGNGSRGAAGFPNVMHLPITDVSGTPYKFPNVAPTPSYQAPGPIQPAPAPVNVPVSVPNGNGGTTQVQIPIQQSSPSNMPMAQTPSGVQLPQLSFVPEAVRNAAENGSGQVDAGSIAQSIFQNYTDYVVNAWTNTLTNFGKNAGQIALQGLGNAIGIDFSGIMNIASSVGGVSGDIAGLFDTKGSKGKGSNLPADPEVQAILQMLLANPEYQALPPEYQQDVAKAAMENPSRAMEALKRAVAQALASSSAFQGHAAGGKITGPGNGTSDSILARVSHGEYIVKASAAKNNMGLLNAINSGVPGFAEGGMVPPVIPVAPPPVPAPAPPPVVSGPSPVSGIDPAAVPGPAVTPAPIDPSVTGPQVNAPGVGPAALDPAQQASDQSASLLDQLGGLLGGIGGGGGGAQGSDTPAGGDPKGDPRAVMSEAPKNLDHNRMFVDQGIQGTAAAIGGAISTALSLAAAAGGMAADAQAPGASVATGAAASGAGSLIGGAASAIGGAISGAVNILSSLGVGTLSPGKGGTGGAYGTPLVPQKPQNQRSGPAVVNNWGGVKTSNEEEFFRTQQRKELQNASPMLPRR